MRTRALGPLAALCCGGCLADLPASPLGEHAVALFRAFDVDPAALPALVADADLALDDFDLEGGKGDRLFDLPPLGTDDLGGADVPGGLDADDQMRAGMVGLSSHGLDDNLRAQLEVNFTCANARAVKCHERRPVDGSDADRFLDGADEVYRTENTIRIQTLPIDFWIQAPVDFRWVELDDGRLAAVGRTWIREPFHNDSGKKTWKQRFGVDLFVEDGPDRTRRMYAAWNGPVVDGMAGAFVQTALRRGLDDGFTRPDDWLDAGEPCDVDLDRCLEDAPF